VKRDKEEEIKERSRLRIVIKKIQPVEQKEEKEELLMLVLLDLVNKGTLNLIKNNNYLCK